MALFDYAASGEGDGQLKEGLNPLLDENDSQIPNQSSVPKTWTEFTDDGRMKPSGLRDRVVDVMEELVKFTLLTRPVADMLVDRYSERDEKRKKGRLLSQQEKEAEKEAERANAL